MSPHPAEWHDRVAAYALGADPPRDREAVEAHLAVCGECRSHLAVYSRVVDELEAGWSEPPPGSFQRIQARLARERLPDDLRAALDGLGETIATEGLREACSFLNARAPYRFTGIFRLEPPVMSPLGFFDREQPEVETTEPIRLARTYCSIILASQAPFHTEDAAADPRLADHPSRECARAYCGVFLSDDRGEPFGTLCHFDLEPRPVPMREIPLLQAAAPLVMRSLGA